MISDILELNVYNVSLQLLKATYVLVREIPKTEYDTIVQIKRAAKSIPANNAEGFGKKVYPREFKRYLQIAIGSSDECVTHLRMLYITVPKFKVRIKALAEKYKILSKRLNKLRSSWLTD